MPNAQQPFVPSPSGVSLVGRTTSASPPVLFSWTNGRPRAKHAFRSTSSPMCVLHVSWVRLIRALSCTSSAYVLHGSRMCSSCVANRSIPSRLSAPITRIHTPLVAAWQDACCHARFAVPHTSSFFPEHSRFQAARVFLESLSSRNRTSLSNRLWRNWNTRLHTSSIFEYTATRTPVAVLFFLTSCRCLYSASNFGTSTSNVGTPAGSDATGPCPGPRATARYLTRIWRSTSAVICAAG
mmetsp:Transcript_14541/g.32963  ORF Transcript_14541/g.32963 Transcript_14541/m.32963 type:complete len:239 (+) Transcript_14541:448-1164(+)